jgi:hypothetical protein
MTISDAWFVLYQLKYKTPSIFDLHESGKFKTRPSVTKDYGFRLIVNEEFQVKMQFVHLIESDAVDETTGIRYPHVNKEIFIHLMENLLLNEEELNAGVPDDIIRNEIISTHKEWYDAYVPLNQNNEVDKSQLEKKLTSYIKEAKEIIRKELVRKNNAWIQAALPRLIYDFNHGLYQRMSDKLYPDYMAKGGDDTEKDLIKKIHTFYRIYEYDQPDVLLKPDGSKWKSEDEIWNCWVAFAGSEPEAKRVCSTIETIFRPVLEEMSRE